MTIRFVEPSPRIDPMEAAELRARLAGVSDSLLRDKDPRTLVGGTEKND
jgi:hypothetical protein